LLRLLCRLGASALAGIVQGFVSAHRGYFLFSHKRNRDTTLACLDLTSGSKIFCVVSWSGQSVELQSFALAVFRQQK
jgi:hypothetical protein